MDLGVVFAGVPRVGVVRGCAQCYSPAELELLGGDPALVPDRLVASFAREVPDHWSADQYDLLWRGFAPRILGLLDAEPDEFLGRGLGFARVETWPAAERTALRTALRELVARAVTGGRPAPEVAALVCAAAHLDGDLTPWLHHLDTLTGGDADAGIARLAKFWAEDLARGEQPIAPGDPGAALREWLYSDPLWDRLSRANARDATIAIANL